ncbi:uncharacterized protein BDR25DRAFT_313823 [Lindgomyces ingoldianus]|uniref:Uncharacterized protein n=1 Tax=Lindgomyces ingoldianus TaxID=673940 RepID=A0ACB6QYN8_9PLEO|nr:uncharacterized protein BDR25DRAFT_313823 [Lindgomyces ingoldianus]KAF2471202.1 hypothetical protein BDR25DRAFT_313823 [Lindgomyces ingoldianus]
MDVERQQLLSSFPNPPAGVPSRQRPTTSPIACPSDFGYIQVCMDPDYKQVVPQADHAAASSEFSLVLDNPKKLFSPLDTITGYINGWSPSCPSQHVHIILEGRAKSYITIDNDLSHKDRTPLLYQITHLLSSSQVVPRFSIPIPEHVPVELKKLNALVPRQNISEYYWTHEWPALDPYEYEAGHPLPPSVILPRRSNLGFLFNAVGRGYIEYKLTAIRSRVGDGGKMTPDANFQVPIWLTTLRLPSSKLDSLLQETNSISHNLSIQTLKLLSDKRLSFGELFRDAFSSSTPGFYFTPTITIPKLSIPGANLLVSISVTILPPPLARLYNFPVPSVSISSFHCRIRSYTGIRTKGLLLTPSHAYTFKHCELRCEKQLPTAAFHPKEGGYEGQKCVVTIALPRTILPSFKTFNFWRSYKVEVDVAFSCAGKEVVMYAKSDLNVVARPADGRRDGEVEGDLKTYKTEPEEEITSLEMATTVVEMTSLGLGVTEVWEGLSAFPG